MDCESLAQAGNLAPCRLPCSFPCSFNPSALAQTSNPIPKHSPHPAWSPLLSGVHGLGCGFLAASWGEGVGGLVHLVPGGRETKGSVSLLNNRSLLGEFPCNFFNGSAPLGVKIRHVQREMDTGLCWGAACGEWREGPVSAAPATGCSGVHVSSVLLLTRSGLVISEGQSRMASGTS